MYKLTFCLRRAPGTSREEFQRYWREVHASLVAERAEALGVRRYVQSHTCDLAGLHSALQARNGGSPEPFDGVAELWFDALEFPGDDAAQRAGAELLADEQRFIDLPNSPIFVTEEHVIVG
jgi:uncharacterized protein (TIGR02118 family)